jgi:hypothetical protein
LRGIDGASWNDKRRRDLVVKTLQVSKYSVEPHIVDPKRVFKKTPIGPCLGNDSKSFRPEPAVISLASLLPGTARRLARDSCCENKPICPVSSVEISYISDDRNSRVGPSKKLSASFVILAEYLRFYAYTLTGKSETSYTGEKINMVHHEPRIALPIRTATARDTQIPAAAPAITKQKRNRAFHSPMTFSFPVL